MRQTHMGGEKVFVDFAGDTIDIFDPITGEAHAMKLFVAAMGASNYTYAEACRSESLPDWIGMHINLFRFLGGVPKFVVCDNLKAAVTNPDRYDPGLNRTYAEMASHYGTAILAARPRRPKDKAKVEVAVQIAQRWILARLRHQRFFSLAELNAAIAALIEDLNARPMRKLGVSRRKLFEQLDQPALLPLPSEPFVYAEWRIRRVALDYHVVVPVNVVWNLGVAEARFGTISPVESTACSAATDGPDNCAATAGVAVQPCAFGTPLRGSGA